MLPFSHVIPTETANVRKNPTPEWKKKKKRKGRKKDENIKSDSVFRPTTTQVAQSRPRSSYGYISHLYTEEAKETSKLMYCTVV